MTFFPSPERALRALSALTQSLAHDLAPATSTEVATSELPDIKGVVAEYRSKAILAAAGIAIPSGAMAKTLEEARSVADEIGYPLVLKAQSADLSHKSDAGGVVLGLDDAEALGRGWARLHADVARHRPGLALDGVLVEKMGRRGLELIVGARNDETWGPVVLVGFGGVLAEIVQDTRLIPAELSREMVLVELDRLKSSKLLHGYRGEPALDISALADVVLRIAGLVRTNPRIREIDVNPVIVYPNGEGAVALDGLMLLD